MTYLSELANILVQLGAFLIQPAVLPFVVDTLLSFSAGYMLAKWIHGRSTR